MMNDLTFGERILNFYDNLDFPKELLPPDIDVMMPLKDKKIFDLNEKFYRKYYNDHKKRMFLIGINPGRYGGGLTGIPFTDPVNLQDVLQISNELPKQHELSSRFMYQVIETMGGPEAFFSTCYLTAVSPLGFVMNGKNINYYDSERLSKQFEMWFKERLSEQVDVGARVEVAFSLGRGKNYKFLSDLNSKCGLFSKLVALPHPRWVMQYRYPQRTKFAHMYASEIHKYL